jgi:hypothetical protein
MVEESDSSRKTVILIDRFNITASKTVILITCFNLTAGKTVILITCFNLTVLKTVEKMPGDLSANHAGDSLVSSGIKCR